jgi:hypothetical protein
MNRVQQLAKELLEEIENGEHNENSSDDIQILWAKFKSKVVEYGKHCSRFVTNEYTQNIRAWRAQLLMVIHDQEMPLADRWEAIVMLEDKIKNCQMEQAQEKTNMSKARYDVEGETLRTNRWTQSVKGYHPRDTIHEFKIDPGGNSHTSQFENRPKKMAQMARDYHETIQEKDLPDEYGRILATELVLEKCNVHISEDEYRQLDNDLTESDIREALKLSKTGRSPGLDGLPYEFFRMLDIKFQQNKKNSF